MRRVMGIMALLSVPLLAGDSDVERRTFKGVTGVSVIVEDIPEYLRSHGLSVDQMAADVELKLRLAGITIINRQADTIAPAVYISVNVLRADTTPMYAYDVSIEFLQPVQLTRNREYATATTWNLTELGIVGENNIRVINETVKKFVDRFINAYLSVNPRQ